MDANSSKVIVEIDIEQAQKDLDKLTQTIKDLNEAGEGNEEVVKELEKQWDRLDSNIKKAKKAQESLPKQLNEIKQRLQQLSLAGKENTKEYQNLLSQAGKIKDAMSDTSQAIRMAASDTSSLDAALGALSAATGGFGLATSLMSMFNIESENAEKIQKRLLQAISLVNSVQQLANALNKDSALMVKLNAVAHSLFAKQLRATASAGAVASASMKGLRTAIVTTGLGALVVALGAVVNKILDVVEANKKMKDSAKDAAQSAKTAFSSLKDAYGDYIEVLKGVTKSQNDRVVQLIERTGNLNKMQQAYTKNLKDSQKETENLTKKQQGLRDEIKTVEDEYLKWEAEMASMNNVPATDANIRILEATSKNYEFYAQKLENLTNKDKELSQQILASRQDEWKWSDKLYELDQKRLEIAKERKNLITSINKEIDQSWLQVLEAEADMAKEDPAEYYRLSAIALKANVDVEKALEDERYKNEKADLRRLGANRKAREDAETLHRLNLTKIWYNWQARQQALDDKWSEHLDDGDRKREEAAKEEEELYNERLQRYNAFLYKSRLINADDDITATLNLKKEALKAEYDLEIENAERIGKETTEIKAAYENEKLRLEREATAQRLDIAQQLVGGLADTFSLLFEDDKEVQMASLAVSTVADAAATFGKAMAQGGPYAVPLAVASAAAVTARGVAAMKQIQSMSEKTKSIPGASGPAEIRKTSAGTSSVSQAIISRNAGPTAAYGNGWTPVLVVDDVTYRQRQQDRISRVSTI